MNEHGDRHAPGALAADAPVGAGGNHGADAVAALVGHEMRGVDGGEGFGADVFWAVEADEPLRSGAEDQRRTGPPGMRVGVADRTAGQQVSCFCQRGGDGGSGFVDVLAGEQRDPGVEGAVVAYGFGDVQIVGAAEDEIVLAVAGGDVDEAGAGFGGDEVGQKEGRVLVVAVPAQGVGHDCAREVGAFDGGEDGLGGDAGVLQDGRQQGFGRTSFSPIRASEPSRDRVHADHRVVKVGAGGNGAVAGHGPGGRGPDHHRGVLQRGNGRGDDGEANPDRGGGVVVILDLGFGECGLFDR